MSPARLLFILSAILVLSLSAAAHKSAKETTFIFMRDADTTIMSGSLTDLQRVKKDLQKGDRVLWFRGACRQRAIMARAIIRGTAKPF
ncbi:MAG: hypothetical protein M4D80_24710 [Myxococcota bacterium]|nr:hypothetical protein [Myxococcota bacterium]